MSVPRGTFIVLEGVDGSGKATQFKLLESRLRQAGYDVATFDFPRYDQPSSYFVRQYLEGAYGGVNAVGPYTTSLFYALDRFQATPHIREALDAGKIVLANRYTGSSMAHQGTKFRTPEERRGYFIWLDNLEFEMLKIPRPDISFVLRVPVEISLELIKQRGEKADIHENAQHLSQTLAVYDDMTQLFPKDFQRIDCVRGDKLMEVDAVQALLWQKISPLLPPPPQLEMPMPSTAAAPVTPPPVTVETPQPAADPPAYYVPAALDDDTKRQYRLHIEAIMRLKNDMHRTLGAYLTENGRDASEADALLEPLTPLALYAAQDGTLRAHIEQSSNPALHKLATEQLPGNHAAAVEPVQLADAWPRNEFDLVADMLYAESDLSLNELRTQTGAWPYNRKLEVLEAYLASDARGALHKAHYTWDILGDYLQLKACTAAIQKPLIHQQYTPRYGYDVPSSIDDAGLTEQYQLGFDASLELYSLLQKAGFMQQSQYATLAGHRVRWKMALDAVDMLGLATLLDDNATRELVRGIIEKLTEVHPILAETIQPVGS